MTQRQKHRCQPSQRHLHFEFNLNVFYLHPTQRRVNGPQKAPVDLLKNNTFDSLRSSWSGGCAFWAVWFVSAKNLRHQFAFSHISEVCRSFQLWRVFFSLFSLTLGFNRISVAPIRQKRIGSARMAAERHITASQSVSVYMRCTLGINFCLLVPYRFVTSSLWHFWKEKKKKNKKHNHGTDGVGVGWHLSLLSLGFKSRM